MSQGMVIKGNTADGQTVTMQVSPTGELLISGNVTTEPTFKTNPGDTLEIPKFGKVDVNGVLDIRSLSSNTDSIIASSPVAQKIGQGKFFIGGGAMTLAAGAIRAIHISNPVGNTKVVYLTQAKIFCDQNGRITFTKNATATGTAGSPFNPNMASAATPTAVITYDATLTGGTLLDLSARVYSVKPYEFNGFVVIPPGVSLAVSYKAPDALGSSANVETSAYWYEE